MFFVMAAKTTFAVELETAKNRRAYWQAQCQAALLAGDPEGVGHAKEHLRQYDWLISWIEGVHEPD
jgi:hypothetical protein